MNKFIACVSALTVLTLHAESVHFFGGGDFTEKGIYGYGAATFSPSMKTIVKWNEADGFMHVELQKGADLGRAGIKFYNSVKVPAGLKFDIRFRARGNGKIWFERGNSSIKTRQTALTGEWKLYNLTLDCSKNNEELFNTVYLYLHGKDAAVDLDDLTITASAFDTLIMPPTGAMVVKTGSQVPEQLFNVYPRDVKGNFLFSAPGELKKPSVTPAESSLGKVTFPGFTAEKEGFYRVTFTTGGVSALRDVVVAPEAEVKALEEAAGKVDLQGKPLRILYLADSLSDFERDHNHAAITAGMLEKYNPGMVTFRNAGIGGDLARYIQWRLNTVPEKQSVMRRYMYDEIWAGKYDIIFISVGQNDTLAFARHNFKEPQLPLRWTESYLRDIVTALKKKTDARIVLVSGFSTPENNNKSLRFGVPELVEDYNRRARKVAGEFGVEFFDIYSEFKKFSNEEKLKLYNSDLVHLSPAGHRMTALKYLEYLAL